MSIENKGTTPHHTMNKQQKSILGGIAGLSLLGLIGGLSTLETQRSYMGSVKQTQSVETVQFQNEQNKEWNQEVLAEMKADGLDQAHYQLLKTVSDQGVVLFYNSEAGENPDWVGDYHCGADMVPLFGVEGQLGGWYDPESPSMSICAGDEGISENVHYTIRHEVGHFIQDLADGKMGDAQMVPFFDVEDPAFDEYVQNDLHPVDRDYAMSYCEAGDYVTCDLEADAEVQATSSTPQDMVNRIHQFVF